MRERLGVAQAELCRAADVSEGTYFRARRRGHEPTPRIRQKLVAALEEFSRRRGLMLVTEARDAAE